MRIIGGKLKGRKLHPPRNLPVRPTTDFAKESLFNILANRFEMDQIHTLDLFSGTGNISFELASRGCPHIVSVDKNEACVRYIKQTAEALNADTLTVRKMDALQFLQGCKEQFDFIFADPPYAMKDISRIPNLIFEKNLLAVDGWFVLEHDPKLSFDNIPRFLQKRAYGSTVLSIFE